MSEKAEEVIYCAIALTYAWILATGVSPSYRVFPVPVSISRQAHMFLKFVMVFSIHSLLWRCTLRPEVHGFALSIKCSDSDSITTASSIVTMACFDALVATLISWFWSNGTNKEGGHRQKPSHDTFLNFISLVCYLLIGTIRLYVKESYLPELSLSALLGFELISPTPKFAQREANIKIYVTSIIMRLVAILRQWFCELITDKLDSIQERYVAEHTFNECVLELYETAVLDICP